MKMYIIIPFISIILFLSGCGGTRVERMKHTKTVDLSGRWNDTDSRLVAEAMIEDALTFPWITEFEKAHNKKPTIIAGRVINKSYEHINTETFIKDLQRALIRSGRVVFVVASLEKDQVRKERLEQIRSADPKTAKKLGKEIGADFLLTGTINSIIDEVEGKRVVYYQVDLELVNIETNVIVWPGQKKIKKLIERPKVKL